MECALWYYYDDDDDDNDDDDDDDDYDDYDDDDDDDDGNDDKQRGLRRSKMIWPGQIWRANAPAEIDKFLDFTQDFIFIFFLVLCRPNFFKPSFLIIWRSLLKG